MKGEPAGSGGYDVAVIGAGPAGAVAARGAAQRGASVLLVDKAAFPRAKVCGCCLSRDALAMLDRLGLGARFEQLGARSLDTFYLATARRAARVPLPEAAAVSRAALDAALVDAARAKGVVWHDATHAALVAAPTRPGAGHRLSLRAGGATREVTARAVLVADGIGGHTLDAHPGFQVRVRSHGRIGLATILAPEEAPPAYEPGVIHMACARHGYVGLVRLEDGSLNVAAALDPRFIQHRGGPAGAVWSILREVAWPTIDALNARPWHGTPRLSRHRRPLARDGIFLLGDAAGYVEPFTGEGIAWALRTGESVADLAVRSARAGFDASLARQWSRRYGRHIASRQRRCRCVTALLCVPWALGLATLAASRLPWAVRPLVEAIAGPGRARSPAVDAVS